MQFKDADLWQSTDSKPIFLYFLNIYSNANIPISFEVIKLFGRKDTKTISHIHKINHFPILKEQFVSLIKRTMHELIN